MPIGTAITAVIYLLATVSVLWLLPSAIAAQSSAPFADAIAPGVVLAQAIGRWGNWFNQELFGAPTTLPWGLEIAPQFRPEGYSEFATFHPTFLYESLWMVGVALVLIWADKRFHMGHGRVFALYVLLYCLGRGHTKRAMGAFRDAWRRGDEEAAALAAERDLGLHFAGRGVPDGVLAHRRGGLADDEVVDLTHGLGSPVSAVPMPPKARPCNPCGSPQKCWHPCLRRGTVGAGRGERGR